MDANKGSITRMAGSPIFKNTVENRRYKLFDSHWQSCKNALANENRPNRIIWEVFLPSQRRKSKC